MLHSDSCPASHCEVEGGNSPQARLAPDTVQPHTCVHSQVLDGVLGMNWCLAAQSEIEGLRRAGRLHANATHILRSGERQLLPKAGILEAELLDPVCATAALVYLSGTTC